MAKSYEELDVRKRLRCFLDVKNETESALGKLRTLNDNLDASIEDVAVLEPTASYVAGNLRTLSKMIEVFRSLPSAQFYGIYTREKDHMEPPDRLLKYLSAFEDTINSPLFGRWPTADQIESYLSIVKHAADKIENSRERYGMQPKKTKEELAKDLVVIELVAQFLDLSRKVSPLLQDLITLYNLNLEIDEDYKP